MNRKMKVEATAVKAMSLLSPEVQIRLAGGKPISLDGQTLDPGTQLLLAVAEKQGGIPKPGSLPVGKERYGLRRQAIIGAGPPESVTEVRDLQIDGAEGKIGARFYRTPEVGGPHPLLVFYHGGCFVLGDLDSHDSVCRAISVHAGVDVLAVDYRLAPENPFPAATDDARAAYDWAMANAADLGSDPTRVAVGGDSAGGNLAAVTAISAAQSLAPPPIAQFLIYPIIDFVEERRSKKIFSDGFFLTTPQMRWFGSQYAGELGDTPEHRNDWRVSPIRAEDLSGVAPALIVTAGFDPLRDEGEEYGVRLAEAGVHVVHRRFPDLVHGFMQMTGASGSARDALLECAGALRTFLRR
jgi:acetyl esterase